ncbi:MULTISPECIES: NADPH-dependent FMN reductase [Streptomyces]|uniref:NAD(P)H-dependent oxidoreductase n=2 Tax=Streptomyces TaxID=1883 RepID=A0ABX1GXU9_9ACTN|nr:MULTISPECIES: NAD(P)H-dependent oxidoreductase [Streptomyces]AJE82599.1 putative NADPH-dependent FMN reductase [Streptomyces albus]AOU76913.1 putative NADPH-dependent FMN reductase [Streptomyces albus]AYN32691.1 NADPH-dependent oxidoreductase [Streptomyces albus]NKI39955.1 NAD(P)H-dependent oxidoreductase [Streptomyces physcomitrii]
MDDRDRLRLVILVGATRQGRFGLTAAEWLAAHARSGADFEVDVIDLATAWLPDLATADTVVSRPSAVRDLAPWLDAADAFAVVTTEYRHSYPASLKNTIDWYDREWQAKPVAFLSFGGASGGHCAVSQLRQVFAEVDAVTVRETVSFPECPGEDHAGGQALDPAEGREGALHMLDRLGWWARALREARAREPYESTKHSGLED